MFSVNKFGMPLTVSPCERGGRRGGRGGNTVRSAFPDPSRLTPGYTHFPEISGRSYGDSDDPVQRTRRQRCMWCSRINGLEKKTMYSCKACKVSLCIIPCFEYYHTSCQ